jgi:hypothetical protein
MGGALANEFKRIKVTITGYGRRKVTAIFSSPGGVGLHGEKISAELRAVVQTLFWEGVKRHIS